MSVVLTRNASSYGAPATSALSYALTTMSNGTVTTAIAILFISGDSLLSSDDGNRTDITVVTE